MRELFVDKSVTIAAPATKVWEVLTRPEYAREWVRLWWPDFALLESDWQTGSSVIWQLADGTVGSQGTISLAQPYTLLSFSFQVNNPYLIKQEEITYRLDEQDGHTHLSVTVGNFGDTPEHEACYPGALQSWETSLPKIKELAESR
ncbi:hypothetical protein EPA93_02150 [Ktedonosporobacter rubrisoli]|uniref:Activator of Hsp90 ATPase homologue 1/2-like C-terminal domain-containing protein n=1 Tax=Ktedonosporobacter rubrisoli TaxID=2509675 RepID=A0A4P6JIH2_KTERU|nr:SRPBCC domain-containing protein [Ktedonosporobacter rubrisoli]QBD74858.1 hypothetical protein EPA93_02150 [Ktedonosporobacter rubrisoli]